MTTRVYSRCNSGHYFAGECCPFDGWSSAASKEITSAVKRLARSGRQVSVAELRKLGVSNSALARTIVIEFGADSSAFDAIAPQHLSVLGATISAENLDESFT